MKASEVINKLKALIEEHGDLETHAFAGEESGIVTNVECVGGPGYAHIKEKIFTVDAA